MLDVKGDDARAWDAPMARASCEISGSAGAAMGPGTAESPARRAKLISPLRQRWVPDIQELRSPFQGRHNSSEKRVSPLKGGSEDNLKAYPPLNHPNPRKPGAVWGPRYAVG